MESKGHAMKGLAGFLLVLGVAVLLGVAPAMALVYTNTPVTTNIIPDANPQVNDYGQIVYQQYDGFDWEIFLTIGPQTKQLTNNDFDDVNPVISNGRYVAWSEKIPGPSTSGDTSGSTTQGEIFLYDINTDTTRRLTYNTYDDRNPQVNVRGQVTWEGQAGVLTQYSYTSRSYEIFVYDYYENATKRLTYNTVNDLNPQLNNQGNVVWEQASGGDTYQGGGSQIFMYNQSTNNIANLSTGSAYSYDNHAPQINNNNWVVWYGTRDEEDYGVQPAGDIFRWQNNQVSNLTNDEMDQRNPQIGDNNDIVWQGMGWSGGSGGGGMSGYEIFARWHDDDWNYQLTWNNYDDLNPYINDRGQVVWTGAGIWTHIQGQSYKIADTGFTPQINNQSQVVYAGFDGTDEDIFLSESAVKQYYSFKYTYGNGDYYLGFVIAPTTKGYYVGQSWTAGNEVSGNGYYTITNIFGIGQMDPVRYGQVWVTAYYDGDGTKDFYQPLNSNSTNGNAYLGSEKGYLVDAVQTAYRFGKWGTTTAASSFYEADAGDKFRFRYNYGNGDYYDGYVYASPGNYPLTLKKTQANEASANGFYEILGIESARVATSLYGQVFVDTYYDGDQAKKFFNIVNDATALGTAYLGSEKGYIGDADNLQAYYQFGRWVAGTTAAGFYEADAGDVWAFRYIYGNGDYYDGFVVASPGYGYYKGRQIAFANETGSGYYEITGVRYEGAPAALYGQVFVNNYYDGDQTRMWYNIPDSDTPKGAAFLGSESGYIKDDVQAYHKFGKWGATTAAASFLEADAADTFWFKYVYGNEDAYWGYVYASPDYASNYYVGKQWTKANEVSATGFYEITSAGFNDIPTAQYGQVFVNSYNDGESHNNYAPLDPTVAKGIGYLGSEQGYIVTKNHADFQFGLWAGVFKEADAGDKFWFRYTYGNGDSHWGYVYAAPNYGYFEGKRWTQANEVSALGYYEINGVQSTGDTANYGKVFVEGYADGDQTNQVFTPINPQLAKGGGYLGSEQGYIVNTLYEYFQFGRYVSGTTSVFKEADAGDKYGFRYNYGNGDYYDGYFFINPTSGYSLGQRVVKANEASANGYYQITSVGNSGTAANAIHYGEVYVTNYFDGDQTKQNFAPVSQQLAKGRGYLGSEAGYIVNTLYEFFQFGLYVSGTTSTFKEADAGDKYWFTYYYGNGDTYDGYFFKNPNSGYSLGDKVVQANEVSANGYYQITGVGNSGTQANAIHYGEIYVTNYFDGDQTKQGFGPVDSGLAKGTAYMGSEKGYIINDGSVHFQFGRWVAGTAASGFYEADAGDTYNFQYVYNNGDTYSGTVYADPSYGYYVGRKWTRANEANAKGYYEITGMWNTGDPTRYGQVFVNQYFDGDRTQDTFAPLESNLPQGAGYLGTEKGYLISKNSPAFQYGVWPSGTTTVLMEADLDDRFGFRYTYGNGDYYEGYVISAPDSVLYVGRKWTRANEASGIGYYLITDAWNSGNDYNSSLNGQVFVNGYYDGDQSKQYFYPLNSDVAMGSGGLGGEKGYIIAQNTYYQFGYWGATTAAASFLEADAGDKWNFRYTYGNGDYYDGTVYAAPNKYYLGQKIAQANELGTPGYYQIISLQNSGIVENQLHYGQVFVNQYYDGDLTKQGFTPVDNSLPIGLAYLGSEHGSIVNKQQAEFKFGKWGTSTTAAANFWEADAGDRYYFRYFYGNGDYYDGYVYAPAGTYTLGAKILKGNVFSATAGYYQINSMDTTGEYLKYGQVYVNNYYDGDQSQDWASPLHNDLAQGIGYLGTEGGYISTDKNVTFRYGRTASGTTYVHEEADIGDYYEFTYYYNNGDYYNGYGYANPAAAYHEGQKIAQGNETGSPGYYQITVVEAAGEVLQWGQVFVNYYYDGDQGAGGFNPLNFTNPLGVGSLGSEKGYIVNPTEGQFQFGRWVAGTATSGFYEADAVNRWSFRYTYGNGDYYDGYVYADPTKYYRGQKFSWANEEVILGGFYQITGSGNSGNFQENVPLYGQVFVTNYYDGDQTRQGFAPVEASLPLGTGYLGTEQGWIVNKENAAFKFGNWSTSTGVMEADAGDQYYFRYNYGNGDYYNGYVFAAPGTYAPGEKILLANIVSATGYYQITGIGSPGVPSKYGQVYVTDYYDGDQSQDMGVPVNSNLAQTTAGLGKESGYIITDKSAVYRYGRTASGDLYVHEEADIGDSYNFTYYYNNGDYYNGVVYRTPGAYHVGQKIAQGNETGKPGYYQITGVNAEGDTQRWGQVFVNNYYDGDQTKQWFTPVNNSFPLGVTYLGSEKGYIGNTTEVQFQFGKWGATTTAGSFYEADAGNQYTFQYTYGNGDFYEGYVYAAPSYGYFEGQKLTRANEVSSLGYYEIIDASFNSDVTIPARYGEVYVQDYYDADLSKLYYNPVDSLAGKTYLGGEKGYIVDDNSDLFKFGNWLGSTAASSFFEADAGEKWYFTYYYGNGDYFNGLVYAAQTYGYYVGKKWNAANEVGTPGYYQITNMSSDGTSVVEKYGQVFVSNYYDGDVTKGWYTPINSDVPQGKNYLGSESGKIVLPVVQTAAQKVYQFGVDLSATTYVFQEADAGDTFYFKYVYCNGDYYTGYVVGEPNHYVAGEKKPWDNEVSATGYYVIQSVSQASTPVKYTDYGKVYVSSYYDGDQTKSTFYPYYNSGPGEDFTLVYTNLLGFNWLGSEKGYIVAQALTPFKFGNWVGGTAASSFFEADGGNTFTFRYTYLNNTDGSGDYYNGYVYADPAYYSVGQKWTVANESSANGYYQITGASYSSGSDLETYGAVFVNSYYDGDQTKRTYGNSVIGTAGYSYLGNEQGAIINAADGDYQFGRWNSGTTWVFKEADAFDTFTFKYNYGNGDFYIGYIYSNPGQGYYQGYTTTLAQNETGQNGQYIILGKSYSGVGYAAWGQVYVQTYYDGDAGANSKYLAVMNPGVAKGSWYLTSEYGYVVEENVSQYYFGGGYYEADQ